MESVCMSCLKSGMTTILLVKVPFFRELILISFYCENCAYKNTEVQFGGRIGDLGQRSSVKVLTAEVHCAALIFYLFLQDLKRDIIKSDYCDILIPEIELEIPANGKGSINTIEGYLNTIQEDLEQNQPFRKENQPEVHEKIGKIIQTLVQMQEGSYLPFTFELYDPAGNSFIKNPNAPKPDKQIVIESFKRTPE